VRFYSWFFCGNNLLNNDNTGFLNQKVNIIKVGGYFGVATALIAYYCGLAEMLTPNDIFTIPTGKHHRD
jgi:succinate-acetate transporter protein